MMQEGDQLDLMEGLTSDAASAVFSPCRRYRYLLTRVWDSSLPALCFLMLNPSTADQVQNDPTVERCQRRAHRMGFGSVVVVNLFALRSTDPSILYTTEDPVGPENDASILKACREAGMVICAWGTHGKFMERAARVRQLLAENEIEVMALAVNADGSPKHPLYVRNDAEPVIYAGKTIP